MDKPDVKLRLYGKRGDPAAYAIAISCSEATYP
jgi:hypothetical protein